MAGSPDTFVHRPYLGTSFSSMLKPGFGVWCCTTRPACVPSGGRSDDGNSAPDRPGRTRCNPRKMRRCVPVGAERFFDEVGGERAAPRQTPSINKPQSAYKPGRSRFIRGSFSCGSHTDVAVSIKQGETERGNVARCACMGQSSYRPECDSRMQGTRDMTVRAKKNRPVRAVVAGRTPASGYSPSA